MRKIKNKVRRTEIIKKINIVDNLFVTVRKDELTVYKVIEKRGKSSVVYTLDAREWLKIISAIKVIAEKIS